MKKLAILLLAIGATGLSACESEVHGKPYHTYLNFAANENMLDGIQNKIETSFEQSFVTQSDTAMVLLRSSLVELQQQHSSNLIHYWIGYLDYYHSIYLIKMQDEKMAEERINSGIETITAIKEKNSEDLALLAMLQSFAIQFKQGMAAGMASGEVKRNVKKAIKLNPSNLRAYYVAGSNDFYTPEKYGGGEKVEEYLLKALECPDQEVSNTYLPSWGREEAYQMLIRHYINHEKWEEAKLRFQEGIKSYPDSYMMNQLAKQLVGK